jgi:hypothetical protein
MGRYLPNFPHAEGALELSPTSAVSVVEPERYAVGAAPRLAMCNRPAGIGVDHVEPVDGRQNLERLTRSRVVDDG